MQTFTFKAADGVELTGTRYTPEADAKAVVVLPSAMGVKQDFYRPFAQFLAKQGYAVLCFDYRGMGQSRPARFRTSLRGFKADLLDWAQRDYNAALLSAKAWQPGRPLLIVGHSLGGQLVGLVPDNHLIDGVLTIACGTGYWHYNVPKLKRYVWLLWYVLVPFYTTLFGYFPGKRLRKVGDLPRGVMFQWSHWCRHREYVVDRHGQPMSEGYQRMRAPMMAMSFTDDEMMSRRSVDSMHELYANAPQERRYIAPQEVGARRIGHFGFFREQFEGTLWQQAAVWLNQHSKQQADARDAQPA
ncbi:MAG TPA: alpha/beta fold hydrolase [Burkholderiaceae bacterium]